jgi:hypothetical protein
MNVSKSGLCRLSRRREKIVDIPNDISKKPKRSRSYDFLQDAFVIEGEYLENVTKIVSTFSK